uniref:hypothetical protein n=1 Tax=Ralstonia pseudosolanacearum TaxID=1310165 RepID=UPI001FF7366E
RRRPSTATKRLEIRKDSSSYRGDNYCAAGGMPLVMHDATLSFLSKGNIRKREAAALTSVKPDLFANFNSRFESSLVLSLNAIQLLVQLGYSHMKNELFPGEAINVGPDFGKRAERILKATPNIAAVLASPVEELYLNFRIQL